MTSKRSPRVLWLTNLPAPYRFPIWARLAEKLDLKVSFLLKEKNWRNWTVPSDMTWEHEYLSLNSKNFGEFDLIPSWRGAKRLLKSFNLALVGGWEAPFFIRTIFLAKRLKIPVVQLYESTTDSHRFNNFLVKKIRSTIFSQADYIVTSGAASTRAVQAMGIAPEKIVTLFNPVDVTWFDSFACSHRAPVLPGHRFLYVGQLIVRKNVATVLRAFASIRSHDDTLTIAGDGPLAEELKELAGSLGVGDSIFFLGHRNQEELATLYASSNTLILASTNEVWGLVVNEALASGLHVVVSDMCGVAEFIEDMKGAFICQIDQQSIENAMRESLQKWSEPIKDPQILQFTPEKFADALLEVVFR